MSRFWPIIFIVLFWGVFATAAQEGINARAVEDLKAFIKKAEEGDDLFNQKKYADAAAALAAAHNLYQRAESRDSGSGYYKVSIKPGSFPATRFYGYGFGTNPSLSLNAAGFIEGSAAGLHVAVIEMWQDAAILGGLSSFPRSGALSDPPMLDMSEDELNGVVRDLYGPVSTLKLPVPDREWQNVVLWSRRAKLIVEFALQKYPQWKSGTREWSNNNSKLQHTGEEALADIKAKLAEGEPEYEKIMSDAKNAAPEGVSAWIGYKVQDIEKAISGAKRDGWVDWNLARDIILEKDYLSDIRKSVAKMYEAEGKAMPSDALKALESKVAELQRTMEQGASKWKFAAGNPKNASFESKAAAAIKSRISGATVLKSSLDNGQWIITKNDLGIPSYRSMGVLVLAKIPGQKQPWLLFGYVRQTYTGGGTFNSGGTYDQISDVRIQAG